VRECSKCSRNVRSVRDNVSQPSINRRVCRYPNSSQNSVGIVLDNRYQIVCYIYEQLNCSFIVNVTKIYITRVSIVILVTNLRPKRVGDLLHQILSVPRSPDSSVLDCVVLNLDLRSIVPNTRLSTRSPEIIHRGRTYVDRVRTSMAYVRR